MKARLLFIFLLFSAATHAQKIVRALFIGNSYTGVNFLPQTVSQVAASLGDSLNYSSYTPGGYTLAQHSGDATTLALIGQGGWDYVILQAQSQEPSFSPAQVATDVLPYAHILDSLIHKADSCTETIFYMTWGRKNGDASNCATYPPVCTYAGMQQRLRDSYLLMAQQNHASVAPVGCVWREVRATNPAFDLYQADESHPSLWGTYLAACTFYNVLFQKSPAGATFYNGIPQADALLIQQATASDVADSLTTWCGNGDIPFASFDKTLNGTTVTINNSSLNGIIYHWDFGDGSTDSIKNPVHTYLQNGTFPITLTAYNDCKSNSITDTIVITSVGINESQSSVNSIYISNASDGIKISGLDKNESYTIEIFDVNGKVILKSSLNFLNNFLQFNAHLGIYFYKIIKDSRVVFTGKFQY